MAISCLEEAKRYVARKQTIDKERHLYIVDHPYDPDLGISGRNSSELILAIAQIYREHHAHEWRHRIIGTEF